ncbi:DUF4232 domain-containing protein [Streptomyces sp. NPDC004284]|uniref:DUF4232 domain-containing protein n=1 Tax=Streptomyces sp. NPDC004284 TaxID=3364695 RepID=UPI0036B6C482
MTACSSSPSPAPPPSTPAAAPSSTAGSPSAPPAPSSTAGSPSATPAPSSTTGSPSAPPAPSSTAGSPSATPSPTGSARSTGPGRPSRECRTGQLSAALTRPEPAAGSIYATLVFTNRSTTTCTMTGYPGVSYVAQNGVQSGNAAVREPGTITTVTLQPGGRAKAQLRDANGISGYDPAQCKLSPAEGLRIYPPDRTAALFVPWKTEHCAGPTVHSLAIGPVQPG